MKPKDVKKGHMNSQALPLTTPFTPIIIIETMWLNLNKKFMERNNNQGKEH